MMGWFRRAPALEPCRPVFGPASLPRDLPHDGFPEEALMHNRFGLRLQLYRWTPSDRIVGAVVLLHGVRAHLRLTWLAKHSAVLPPRDLPLSRLPRVFDDTSPYSQSSTRADSWNSDPRIMTASPYDRETQPFYHGSWVEALVEAGYQVYGMDLQGHGRSDGYQNRRCVVQHFDDYRDDLLQFLAQVVRPTIGEIPLFLVGVSLSTLTIGRLLQHPSTKKLHITGCCLISGFLREGQRFRSPIYRSLVRLVQIGRYIAPNAPIYMPQKPETNGPDWQLRYGDNDPYCVRKNFSFKMVNSCLNGLQLFNAALDDLLEYSACENLYLLHNYCDTVNPVDGALEPWSELMWKNSSIKMRATIFNAPENLSSHLWHPEIEFHKSGLDLSHTLITDVDNIFVFDHFFDWIISLTPSLRATQDKVQALL